MTKKKDKKEQYCEEKNPGNCPKTSLEHQEKWLHVAISEQVSNCIDLKVALPAAACNGEVDFPRIGQPSETDGPEDPSNSNESWVAKTMRKEKKDSINQAVTMCVWENKYMKQQWTCRTTTVTIWTSFVTFCVMPKFLQVRFHYLLRWGYHAGLDSL